MPCDATLNSGFMGLQIKGKIRNTLLTNNNTCFMGNMRNNTKYDTFSICPVSHGVRGVLLTCRRFKVNFIWV